ncbi:hypothetical protein [Paraburkholderia solisilvae]|uniref:Rap1a immunity protein domain-containing protein n=1 Tax=Paraburkholderia solisilvae TaxID=624376 RepID=A0A6J5EBC0_9BURK|nr:hypothetical protein [Paraburkholderia solisilvae]CAB3763107.1 hypothetical protein LMG29739_04033 [Paraburkholderia solisilvae]
MVPKSRSLIVRCIFLTACEPTTAQAMCDSPISIPNLIGYNCHGIFSVVRKTAAAIVMALTLIATSDAHAQGVIIRGASSCGQWTEAHKSPDPSISSVAMERWLIGYLSGLALGTKKDIIKDTDNASIFQWITNYCNANPLDNVADAGETLWTELIKRKGL